MARRLMALVGGRNCGNSLQLVDLIPETTMQEQFMKLFPVLFAIMISTMLGAAFAEETSTSGANAETAPAPEIQACRASGLIALKERSAAVKDVSLDLDSVTVAAIEILARSDRRIAATIYRSYWGMGSPGSFAVVSWLDGFGCCRG